MENIDWNTAKIYLNGVDISGNVKVLVYVKGKQKPINCKNISVGFSGSIEMYKHEFDSLLSIPKARKVVSRMKHTKGILPIVIGRRKGLYSDEIIG